MGFKKSAEMKLAGLEPATFQIESFLSLCNKVCPVGNQFNRQNTTPTCWCRLNCDPNALPIELQPQCENNIIILKSFQVNQRY